MEKLVAMAKELQQEEDRRKQLGFTDAEEAFYEILANHQTAMQDFELIKQIVKEVTAAIEKNLTIDWHKKGDVKAQIQLSVQRILRRKGVHAELQEILAEIMEQAEARYKEWEFEAA